MQNSSNALFALLPVATNVVAIRARLITEARDVRSFFEGGGHCDSGSISMVQILFLGVTKPSSHIFH